MPGQLLKVYGGSVEADDPPTVSSTYRVVPNDTLSGIGVKTGLRWQDIASLNGIKLPSSSALASASNCRWAAPA